jgi:type II secretory pathway pseudopilin PulG
VIIGILAAIAIPNFIAMQNRAKEGSTKSNMHTFQVSTEDYGVLYDGFYPSQADAVIPLLPGGNAAFVNPFTRTIGTGSAWEDRGSILNPAATTRGITSYADSSNTVYNIKGHGSAQGLTIVLTNGN